MIKQLGHAKHSEYPPPPPCFSIFFHGLLGMMPHTLTSKKVSPNVASSPFASFTKYDGSGLSFSHCVLVDSFRRAERGVICIHRSAPLSFIPFMTDSSSYVFGGQPPAHAVFRLRQRHLFTQPRLRFTLALCYEWR